MIQAALATVAQPAEVFMQVRNSALSDINFAPPGGLFNGWSAVDVQSPGAPMTLSSTGITVSQAGLYEITALIACVNPSTSARRSVTGWWAINGSILTPGPFADSYVRGSSGDNHSSIVLPSYYVQLNAGDQVQVWVVRDADGGAVQAPADNSFLRVRKVPQ